MQLSLWHLESDACLVITMRTHSVSLLSEPRRLYQRPMSRRHTLVLPYSTVTVLTRLASRVLLQRLHCQVCIAFDASYINIKPFWRLARDPFL